jgi:predicted Zn-ribbon and HTH transcriptional regulator
MKKTLKNTYGLTKIKCQFCGKEIYLFNNIEKYSTCPACKKRMKGNPKLRNFKEIYGKNLAR